MKQYAGYSVSFPAFWKYYNQTVKKNYADDYWRSFQSAFLKAMSDEGYKNGFYSNTSRTVFRRQRVHLLQLILKSGLKVIITHRCRR